ncbi:hypothetical protein PM035_12560 [Halorubrum ezzemoulense]|uniref:hypothetical protein n=1 Tax=Halorubrum ezzemoulense TaxID=337243 RepID=UPI00232FB489|nr:hypothetical protein [Halorubrum ezzemoulense]MDB2240456.1 hypothetical protein [Halorubrum ezzemoulense]MDB2261759.1 hypothetical protein [Halorubrum ezzemoulense]MDB2268521.1 hypothetical protein [Halorubrum ezzemoulense]
MGKHERGWVEATEKLTAQLANGAEPDADLEERGRPDLGEALADRLRSDFPDLTAVRHAGNSYDSLGDLIVESPDGETFVEAKFVASGGTRANLGQDTLTQFGLFEDATAWSDFREKIGFPEDREALLREFDGYPDDVRDWSYKSAVYDRAKHLKNVLDVSRGQNTGSRADEVLADSDATEGEREAARIVNAILDLDREEKLAYFDHLREAEQNPRNVETFAHLIVCGYHTADALEAHFDDDLEEIKRLLEADAYRLYEVNRNSGTVSVENPSELLAGFDWRDTRVEIPEDGTSVSVVTGPPGDRRRVLNIAYNWKNKFQGIQTPSMNVFVPEA